LTDSQPPPDPLGSHRDLHLTGLTGVLTLTILITLQETVFRRDPIPADITFWISPVASYLASMVAGRWGRKRLLVAAGEPEGVSPGPNPGETTGEATAAVQGP
jgi:hypothetical protein